jgi:hypothetical protein
VSLTPSSVTTLPETSISVPFRYSDSLSFMHGGVVEMGVAARHFRTLVAEITLDDVVRNSEIDHTVSNGVPILSRRFNPRSSTPGQRRLLARHPKWLARCLARLRCQNSAQIVSARTIRNRRPALVRCTATQSPNTWAGDGNLLHGCPRQPAAHSVIDRNSDKLGVNN